MMEFDRDKFKKLMHYIIWKTTGNDGFGATKLYKAMWFSEAKSYVLRKRPISGAEYVRDKHGPRPKVGMDVRNELVAEGKITQKRIDRGKYKEWVFSTKFPPDPNFLTPDEKSTVNWWVDHIDKDHTATSISDFTHDDAWGIARIGETLPYHAVLITRLREPNDDELSHIRERAKNLGLL